MQLCLQHLCRPGVHRSSGLQKAQAIRMTRGAAQPRRFKASPPYPETALTSEVETKLAETFFALP